MGKELRLLIIEDSEDDVLLALRELRHGGYEPTFERVESAEELRTALERDSWDAIIADYNMPSFNGFQALEIYKESGLDIPFIVVSGTIGEDLAVEIMKQGAHDYIMKNNLVRLNVAISRELRDYEVRRERQKALEALKDSETRYRSLFDTMHEGFALHEIVCNADGKPCDCRFLDVNPAYESLLGISRSAIIGKKALDIFPGMDKRTIERYGEVALGGEVVRAEESSEDGERFFDVLAFSPRKGLFATLVTDVTERKRAEGERQKLQEQIQHTQRLESLGVFAGGIAHDFNNLLMGILGNASLAIAEIDAESPLREPVAAIEVSARRAAELTRQLLAYSGKGSFVVRQLNISQVVREMVPLLKSVIPKSASLDVNLAGGIPTVLADISQIRQVVMNLVANASDALENSGGVVTVATGARECDKEYLSEIFLGEEPREGTYAFIEVSDTGKGMDKGTVKRMFDPFFTTKFTGRGLGLAAVLGIIRSHKGALKVYSEPGKGSALKVLLPAADMGAVGRSSAGQPQRKWEGEGTVLVVDDEEAVRNIAKTMLQRAGFDVVLAGDGEEAVEIFREKHSEIMAVLLDLTMPRMGGERTCERLIEIDPAALVILSSGFSEQNALESFGKRTDLPFIQKPYSFTELRDKILDALSQSR